MKIAFLLPENGISGGIFTIFEHARRLAARGHDVLLIFERERFPPNITLYPGMERVATRFLSDIDPEESWDVAVATWWETAYGISRLRAARYAYFVQGFEERFYDTPRRFFSAFVRETYREDFRFFAASRALQRYLSSEFGCDATHIECAVDEEVFQNAEPLASRPADRVRVLIEGAGDALYKRINLAFDVAGDVPGVEAWYLDPNGTSDRQHLAARHFPRVPFADVPGIYASCDVLLKLSREESVSLPVLEIFATGGTAIVTAFEGHDEYLKDGFNCLVVPIDDDRAARAALESLVADRARLLQLQAGARQTVRRFSWERSSEAFERELASLMSRTDDRYTRLARLTRERADELHQLHQVVDDSERLNASLRGSNVDRSPDLAAREQLETDLLRAQDDARALQHRLDHLRGHLAHLDETQKTLDTILSGRTWRAARLLTWPLRRLTGRP